MAELIEKVNATNTVEPKKHLSLWRVFIALFILGGLAYGTRLEVDMLHETESVTAYKPWFAAYADITATPPYAFEQLGSTPTPDVMLAFIVSSSSDPCVPSWGSHYTMTEAATTLDLDRRIARLQQQGGRVAVSFGGALNSELASACTDQDKLFDAYKSVVDRYHINTMDFDIENANLTDVDSLKRRATVIARLQKEYLQQSNKNLAVWLTLPVAPQGLTKAGTDAIAQMLSGGVDLTGVNVMTMDYGASRQDQTMLVASEHALTETHRQLGILYKHAGINLNSVSLWRKIGATPMIGKNDTADEVFTVEDAQAFSGFAHDQGIGRMSMWSANRDVPCGENYVDVKVVSDSCSGVKTPKAGFSQALSKGFVGSLDQSVNIVTTEDPESSTAVIDDPTKSPYQIWNETGAYPKGVKVVWHGNVYEAKWWTKNDLPDNPVLQSYETPWQLVGPVLLGEKLIEQPTLPVNTYPKWAGTTVYNGGDRVLFEGMPFQAKWWNQGDSPAASAANSDSSPWSPLTQAQIIDILKGLKGNGK